MKAIWYEELGPSSVLKFGEKPRPEPGHGEVLVRIIRSSVNPSATKQRGNWGGDGEMPAPFVIPHNDGSGIIEEVGNGVDEGRVGERIWVYEATLEDRNKGTCAEYCCVPERFAPRLPDNASFETGACLGVPAMTAHRALFADGSIEGKTVLVTGGAGGVGHMAVQLAKWGGARVLATVSSSEQAKVAADCGAEATIDYKKEDVADRVRDLTNGGRLDRVVEVNFAANAQTTAKVLKPYGTVATYASGDDPNLTPKLPFYPMLLNGTQIQMVFVYLMPRTSHDQAIGDINMALSQGALVANISKHYEFSQADVAKAHDDLDAGRFIGKAVIDISAELQQ